MKGHEAGSQQWVGATSSRDSIQPAVFVSPDENTSQMRVPSHLSGLRCVLGAGLVRFRVNASPGASALQAEKREART